MGNDATCPKSQFESVRSILAKRNRSLENRSGDSVGSFGAVEGKDESVTEKP